MAEPDFLVQFEAASREERDAKFRQYTAEAKAAGCTFARQSAHPEHPGLYLIEGWKERPTDQGPIRWQMQEATE